MKRHIVLILGIVFAAVAAYAIPSDLKEVKTELKIEKDYCAPIVVENDVVLPSVNHQPECAEAPNVITTIEHNPFTDNSGIHDSNNASVKNSKARSWTKPLDVHAEVLRE